MRITLHNRPFSALYIHVPFCQSKCGYCAFYSIARHDDALRSRYLKRLEKEVAEISNNCGKLYSIFIGGGTPSILAEDELKRLIDCVRANLCLAKNCEFTVECNPESLTALKLDLLKESGVNRISLGVQSFHAWKRRRLQRAGNARILLPQLVEVVKRFDKVSVDLIYGVPGETIDAWQADLRKAFERQIGHASTYALTLEEGTRLAAAGDSLPGDELFVRLWDLAEQEAASYGLQRYEVSNLAKPGSECRHNLAIWHGAAYAGCGPAGASFNGVDRWRNQSNLEAWLNGAPPIVDRLPAEQRAAEILAFGLRTTSGWQGVQFAQLTGVHPRQLRPQALEKLTAADLLRWDGDDLKPTRKGLLFADTVAEELL